MPSGDGIGPVGQGWTDGGGSRGDGVGNTPAAPHRQWAQPSPGVTVVGGADHGAAATEPRNGWAPQTHTGSLVPDVSGVDLTPPRSHARLQ